MLLNFDNIEKVKVEGLRGGKNFVYLQKLNPTLSNQKMYAKITIPTGSSIGVHTHEVDEEVIYVLSGKGILVIDGVNHDITTGDISLCKRGRNHSIMNVESDDLVLLAIVNE